jgi:NADP-dependent 3-hydroxy acid dehydrogenase YdfG
LIPKRMNENLEGAMERLQLLSGQVAIVTGASSGIGEGVAEELSHAGMKILLTARRSKRLEKLMERLGNCAVVVGDITDPELPRLLIDTALDEFGRCDVVFNGAGTMHTGCVDEVETETMCEMVRVNCEAATRMAYTAVKHFKETGRGTLINVSSILGTKVRPGAGVYAATKHAIEALSEALRMELAKTDVRVSVIEPGLVTTELQDHFAVHPRELLGISQPLVPADVARCVRFILEQPAHVRIPVMMILPGEQSM